MEVNKELPEKIEKLKEDFFNKLAKSCLGAEPSNSDFERFEVNYYPESEKKVFLFDGEAIGEIVEDFEDVENATIKFEPYKKKD